MDIKTDKRETKQKKRKQQIIDIPARPWNASFLMSANENEVHFKTNPWEIRRIWVSTGFLLMSILLVSFGTDGFSRLWTTDYLRIVLGIPLAIYLFGASFYLFFHRVDAVLNKNGLEYRYALLLYRRCRHISLNDILRFEYEAKRIDSRHMEFYAKAIMPDGELRIFCTKSSDAGWMTNELNYMRDFLLTKERGEFTPPFRQDGVLNKVEYRFKHE